MELRRIVRDWSPDVINLHYPGGHISPKDILAVRAAFRGRIVANVHLPVPWSESGERKRRTTRLAASLCHAVIAHSRAMAQTLLDAGVPEAKIHIIHNGAQAPTCVVDGAAARERLGLCEDDVVIGTLARLAPVKGIDLLIDSMALIPSDPVLVIAGDGPERSALELQARARAGSRIRFVGAVTDDPSYIFAASDIFVLPSRLEGLPTVLLEAALRRSAIVATDVGGVAEIIENERDGLIVPPRDAPALAAAITRLLEDPKLRVKLAASAQSHVSALFSESEMVARYAALFNSYARRAQT
jgi:glycosyltransferase involved in cell wall biosynthesis